MNQIYEVWVTSYMWINKGEYLALHETMEDHSNIVIYITANLIYGKDPTKISLPKDIRLTGDHLEGA